VRVSWRERCAWWREFRYLGARDVKRRVDGLREAERFLWWHDNRLKVLGMVIAAFGVLAALLNYLK